MTDNARRSVALHEGTIAILGNVKYDEDATFAVEAEIDQYGIETENSGSWHYQWHERKRQIKVHPFRIELADGTAVMVEPPDSGLRFADEISHKAIAGPTQQLVARLDADEEVVVVGQAQQVATRPTTNATYRESAFHWHLRGAPMWIASTSTAAHFDARTRLHRRQSYQYLALLLPLALVLLRVGDRELGKNEVGTVTSSAVSRGNHEQDAGVSKHSDKIITCAEGPITIHCQKSYYSYPQGFQLPMQVGHYSVNFGKDVRLVPWEQDVTFYVCFAALIATFKFRRNAYRSLPWYRRAPYETDGDGRLPAA